MNEIERINFLIKTVGNNKAIEFANKTGILASTVCKIRKGTYGLSSYIGNIIDAYPQVNRHWLETGEGYPGDLTTQLVKEHYEAKLRRADLVIDRLLQRVEELERVQKECK